MLTDEQIAEIAGKLTEAQKRLLAVSPIAERSADWRTARSLIRRGLLERKGTVPNKYMPAYPMPALRSTPLGLAVHNHLENSRGTD